MQILVSRKQKAKEAKQEEQETDHDLPCRGREGRVAASSHLGNIPDCRLQERATLAVDDEQSA